MWGRRKWEYKFFENYGGNDGYNSDHPLGQRGENLIAELGLDGWELVGFVPFGSKYVFVFKRPRKS
jgi:hypothetical protein